MILWVTLAILCYMIIINHAKKKIKRTQRRVIYQYFPIIIEIKKTE